MTPGERTLEERILIKKGKIQGILYPALSVGLLLIGCGQAVPAYGPEGEYAGKTGEINTEIAVPLPEETENRTKEDMENREDRKSVV